MPELRHRSRFDLTDALAGQVEVLTDLFQGARLATVQAEAELEDLALTLFEWSEQAADLIGEERNGSCLER